VRLALAVAGGFAVGVVLALRMRPATETACCQRVARAVREQFGEKCGPAGALCQSIGDALGIWDHSPAILDVIGL
jgi:hypothetical protein